MARITTHAPRPDLTVVLSPDEADTLFSLLTRETWPEDKNQIDILNHIYDTLNESGFVALRSNATV